MYNQQQKDFLMIANDRLWKLSEELFELALSNNIQIEDAMKFLPKIKKDQYK